jgi:hypothetical protein
MMDWVKSLHQEPIMQHTPSSPTANTIWAELYKRGQIALFMYLCFKLSAVILKPVAHGDEKLVMLILSETATMVILGLFAGRAQIGRDINEFNCYALLTHLLALPAFYLGVPSVYHNETINILLVLVAARLIYFGPRTADGDFAGLPVFGLLGHLQAMLATRQSSSGQLLRHLPTVLFFGSSLPLWLIIARTNDPVIATTAIGLMAFIFAMALKIQREKDAALREARASTGAQADSAPAPASEPVSLRAPVSAPPAFAPVDTPAAATPGVATPTTIGSAHDMAALVVTAFSTTHPDIQPILAAANIHLAQAFPLHPPGLGSNLLERRRQVLDALNGLLLIAQQLEQKKADIDPDVFMRLGSTFGQVFDAKLQGVTVKKYLDLVQEMHALELGDTELFLACEMLAVIWLRVILHEGNGYLGGLEELTRLTYAIIEKYWPDDGYGDED